MAGAPFRPRANDLDAAHPDLALIARSRSLADAFAGGPLARTVTEMFIRVMIVVGLYTFIGNSGVISFGHIGFMCLGAYATAWFSIPPLMKRYSLRGLPDIIAAQSIAVPGLARFSRRSSPGSIAYLFGRILMRLSGIAASIATFAMLAVINTVYSNWQSVTGATSSIVGIPMRTGLWTGLAGAVVAIVAAYLYSISRSGPRAARLARRGSRGQRARRRHRPRASVAFVLSALIIGLAGRALRPLPRRREPRRVLHEPDLHDALDAGRGRHEQSFRGRRRRRRAFRP